MKLEPYIALIGAFAITPKEAVEKIGENNIENHRFAHLFVNFMGIFTGFVLIFYFFYPEVFWISGSINSGPNLFVLIAANPNFMIFGLLGVYLLISGLNHYFFHSIWFRIFIHYLSNHSTQPSTNSGKRHTLSEYLFIQSFSLIPIGFLNIWMILWIYFFEKFNYAKVIFPIFDLTIPVLIQIIGIGIFIAIKFRYEYLINIIYLKLPKKIALIPILFKILIFMIGMIIVAQIINQFASQFA
jgi:hypothetical protein